LVSAQGETIHLVVLTAHEAEDAWKIRIGGDEYLLVTAQDIIADPDAESAQIRVHSFATPHFSFTIAPPLAVPLQASQRLQRTSSSDRAVSFSVDANARKPKSQYRQIQAAGVAPPVKLGPVPDWRPNGVAQAPPASDLLQAAKWSIVVPKGAMDGLSEIYLQIRYQGDVARLESSHRLLTDDFYNGRDWSIGLGRFLDAKRSSTFELSILPLRKDAPVYFENPNEPQFSANGQIVKLDGLSLIPEYELVLGVRNRSMQSVVRGNGSQP
jgi:hypothetical protein